ncbi:hypothetical protein QBC36DRAFT_199132 [Triangularia setosa]|uniref:Rhodopsin domain-containing protein n=1 Tax=Triangularia setosa TaxID=2587417 RepID=A0AAN7A3Z5_9PEZI|nr:hypothetical protein QBC36DRAFT_199132 [Podospora setosa]
MLVVLGMVMGTAINAQLRLHYVYIMEDVGNGLIPMPPTFMEDVPRALHGVFAQGLLGTIGIYAVKLSFLLFFYRLGNQITFYLIFWWCVALITLISFGVNMGLLEYKCMLSGLEVIFFECTSKADIRREWRNMIIYCTLDAFTDVLILCLPITILWNIRLTMYKRLLLCAVFGLTLFTVAVTIIRGTIHQGRIASDFTQSMNIGWVWFWLSIEFFTGSFSVFIIPLDLFTFF